MDGRYFISFSKKSALTPLGQISNRSSLDEASSKDVSNSEFTENKQFMKLLQETVAEHIHNDFAYIIEAGAAPSSYVPIYDFRSPPSYGRATDADGALGYVRADESGKIMPGSYESNYSYRPLSDPYGFLKLSDHIYEKLLERLEK
ncbi:unnamed protein product [Kuraishia capsulata CBS 1993]|uniref:Uncharacterized protein n=1 Tax=Kuraishia capsulata CBS 1993 TaxID=1382522 RepID=W6MTR8_9ASCO|nr:uncharacterized protein KUCA_T00005872001 [Kuraishia capsulata CBS 1993]CDK29878.1 unnamed protein product [Kuraishia capsulata CBS 1993]